MFYSFRGQDLKKITTNFFKTLCIDTAVPIAEQYTGTLAPIYEVKHYYLPP